MRILRGFWICWVLWLPYGVVGQSAEPAVDPQFVTWENLIFHHPDSAAQLFSSPTSQPTTATNFNLARAFYYWSEGQFESSLKTLQQIHTGIDSGSDRGKYYLAKALNLQGVCNYKLGKYKQASKCLQEALTLFNQLSLLHEAANTSGNLALVLTEVGRYPEALTGHLATLTMAIDTKNAILTGASYLNIGKIYSRLGMTEEADSVFHLAIPYLKEANYRKGLGNCYLELARIALPGSATEAEKYVVAAREIFLHYRSLEGRAAVMQMEGEVAMKLERWEKARDRLVKAIHMGDSIKDFNIPILARCQLALVSLKLNDPVAAVANARLVLAAGDTLRDFALQAEAARLLAQAAEMNNNRDEQLHWVSVRSGVLDSLRARETVQMRTRLMVEFDLRKREQELLLVEKDKKLAEQVALNQQVIVVALIALVVFILILVYVQFKRVGIQKAANELLQLRNEEIEVQNHQLEELTLIRDKIFSIVAHDLRSPLSTLKGMVELYKQKLISPSEMDPYFASMDERLKSTTTLVDNLLEWSKIQMKGTEVQAQLFHIRPVLTEAAEVFQSALSQKSLVLELKVPEDIQVYADRQMVSVVCRNLISNAVKFSAPGQQILIKASSEGGETTLTFIDQGMGMDDEQMASIWKLQKKSTRGTQGEMGNGIGLAICRDMIARNNGYIEVSSAPGKGTTFVVVLKSRDQMSQI